ncbi:MAG: class I SAM-dependent methyltransferase [Planctomycetota bacterium]
MGKVVDERWQDTGSGAHYVQGRWRSRRARERDPRMVAKLLQSIDGLPPRSILDVPSGTGRLRAALGAPFVVQADISASMLTGDEQRLKTPRVQASATALPFPDESFDVVVCCRLLHHLASPEDRASVLRELIRVSRGHVIASYWDAASYAAWRRRTTGPLRRKKRPDVRTPIPFEALRGEVEAAGARIFKRVHSARYISQQAFFLASKNHER